MNAALCVSKKNHGSGQLGAQAGAAADLHLSVTPIWALSLLRRSRPHDSFRLSVRRGDVLIRLQSASLVWSHQIPLTESEFSIRSSCYFDYLKIQLKLPVKFRAILAIGHYF